MTKMSSLLAAQAFFAQQAAPAAPPAAGALPLIPIGLMIAAFYFLMVAPQRKQKKEQDKMLAALGTGDEVITTGGIYGTITNVKDDRFVLRIADNTKIEIGKAFIQAVVKKPE